MSKPHPSPGDGFKPTLIEYASVDLVRMHWTGVAALTFSCRVTNRFDAPAVEYNCVYASHRLEGAFVETIVRGNGRVGVSPTELRGRSYSIIRCSHLKVALFHGPGLCHIGADSRLSSCAEYAVSQEWALAVYRFGLDIDGIEYRARHDDDRLSVMLFERTKDRLQVIATLPLMENKDGLAVLLNHYQVGFLKDGPTVVGKRAP